eukprot:TRINITY_DN60330_c0_g1_i1.p1 TRINITY_DN60330_c0_g1~~TRINITY_DN60330_c0_g1_i1.p1  ORF type:complete len:104 (-),score=16.23 TRINITY_DN60330_c0_g1_i1:95-406(-)
MEGKLVDLFFSELCMCTCSMARQKSWPVQADNGSFFDLPFDDKDITDLEVGSIVFEQNAGERSREEYSQQLPKISRQLVSREIRPGGYVEDDNGGTFQALQSQ